MIELVKELNRHIERCLEIATAHSHSKAEESRKLRDWVIKYKGIGEEITGISEVIDASDL